MFSILNLPNDILKIIFKRFTNPYDITTLQLVSKAFRSSILLNTTYIKLEYGYMFARYFNIFNKLEIIEVRNIEGTKDEMIHLMERVSSISSRLNIDVTSEQYIDFIIAEHKRLIKHPNVSFMRTFRGFECNEPFGISGGALYIFHNERLVKHFIEMCRNLGIKHIDCSKFNDSALISILNQKYFDSIMYDPHILYNFNNNHGIKYIRSNFINEKFHEAMTLDDLNLMSSNPVNVIEMDEPIYLSNMDINLNKNMKCYELISKVFPKCKRFNILFNYMPNKSCNFCGDNCNIQKKSHNIKLENSEIEIVTRDMICSFCKTTTLM